ncbi:type II toxin-antitoxin system RelE/ParE family toxin [Komarekiella sp. 'clone 1']|uniref:Toxin n=1 Tax=Komarekiella delphini-convector SJRDD-AB1 TaxID=2593771 RepID=A0AA40T2J4_9NOST|nr:type II toxin-antitoxin system RelE/ParE family toxin [Komarekiella delphini-convector]MBD6619434.1 type II toxin-antitoxin system RelE/ParE family toxin [Komarekiella delphini-convector SJRDD-AB1]
MTNIFKRPQAELDLLEIWEFIAENNLERADEFLDFLDEKLQILARNPGIGRRREELAPGLRSFVVKNFVVFYQEIESRIDVIRVLHGSRDIESIFRE